MICLCPIPPNVLPGCPVHDPGGRTLPDRIAAHTRNVNGATVTTYQCLDCLCYVSPDADHIPGSPSCQAAAEERRISRSE